MARLRRVLGPLVAVWLLCQSGAMAAAWIPAFDDCTCPHSDGATCPMHHGSSSTTKKTCSMRAVDDPGSLTLVSLLTPSAPVEASFLHVTQPATRCTTIADRSFTSLRPVPPDPPPPRA